MTKRLPRICTPITEQFSWPRKLGLGLERGRELTNVMQSDQPRDESTCCVLWGVEQLCDAEEPARMRGQESIGDCRDIKTVVCERMLIGFIARPGATSLTPEA